MRRSYIFVDIVCCCYSRVAMVKTVTDVYNFEEIIGEYVEPAT